jgi:exonuclease III
MKIATYNVNNINSRLDVLLRWLEEASPDIVCLQELKCEQNKFPERQLKEAGYNAIWKGQKSWNGVAILAKSEIRELSVRFARRRSRVYSQPLHRSIYRWDRHRLHLPA